MSVRTGFLYRSRRYIMSMAVADHTGQAWLQGFNDVGQTVFGMSADELMDLKVSVRSDQGGSSPLTIFLNTPGP